MNNIARLAWVGSAAIAGVTARAVGRGRYKGV